MLYDAYLGVLVFIACLAVLTFLGTYKKANPYGRYAQPDQNRSMAAKPAWLLFESPQLWAFAVTFWVTVQSPGAPAIVLFALWESHYIYRAVVYPIQRNDRGKQFPISAIVFGMLINIVMGFANGYAVAHVQHLMGSGWFTDPRFIIGLIIAVSGWLVNFQTDQILVRLRSDGSTGYSIPYGGAFRWVSAPNYLGEILLWTGWALMSWTVAGLLFAIFTVSNLLPRALSHHEWYQRKFPDYPRKRRAIIPRLL